MTVEELQRELARLDKGELFYGRHAPGTRMFCALEFSHAVRGHVHSDLPTDLPDLRPLNDACCWSSNAARAQVLLPVLAAWWDWAEWAPGRQQTAVARLVIGTVRELIADLPGLPTGIRKQCQAVETLRTAMVAASAAGWVSAAGVAEAVAAVEAAATAAAVAAAKAASAAERAAEAATSTSGRNAGMMVLRRACRIWVEAATV